MANFIRMKELIERKQQLQWELKDINNELISLAENLPVEIMEAWELGIIKFNFPVPIWLKNEFHNK